MSTSPFRCVAVAVDDSPAANAAIRVALSIVARDGELLFVHAINRTAVIAECTTPYGVGDATPALEALESDERHLFGAAQARADAMGVRSRAIALDGAAGTAIAAFLRETEVEAVVTGTHGRRGLARFALGSTAAAIVRAASVPVFVTTETAVKRLNGGFRTILVAVDDSAASASAARCAVAFAEQMAARIVLAHVVEDDAQREAAARIALAQAQSVLAVARVPFEQVELHGSPAEALVACADTIRADAIAIGTHRRGGLERLRLGSVAEAVVRAAGVPAMVVAAGARIGADRAVV